MARTWPKIAGAILITGLVFGLVVGTQPGLILDIAKRLERGRGGLAELTLTAADHDIVYLRGGQGPTLMLIHGFAADKDNWTRIAPYLPGFDLVVVDLPGHGESERDPSASYHIAAQVERLKAIHDELGLGRVFLAGNSMGGHISTAYTVAYPEDVFRLVLLDSGGVTSPEKSELTQSLEKGFNPLLVSDVEDFDRLLSFVFVEPPWIPGPVKSYLAAQAVTHRPFNDKIWTDLRGTPLHLEPLLPQVSVPTLNLWGAQDRVIHPSAAVVFQEGIPECRTEILANTGHSPMIERPEQVAALMVPFLVP